MAANIAPCLDRCKLLMECKIWNDKFLTQTARNELEIRVVVAWALFTVCAATPTSSIVSNSNIRPRLAIDLVLAVDLPNREAAVPR